MTFSADWMLLDHCTPEEPISVLCRNPYNSEFCCDLEDYWVEQEPDQSLLPTG